LKSRYRRRRRASTSTPVRRTVSQAIVPRFVTGSTVTDAAHFNTRNDGCTPSRGVRVRPNRGATLSRAKPPRSGAGDPGGWPAFRWVRAVGRGFRW
jgi:hypothetical protein